MTTERKKAPGDLNKVFHPWRVVVTAEVLPQRRHSIATGKKRELTKIKTLSLSDYP